MPTFTIRSWDGSNPEHIDCDETTAKARAAERARAEGSVVNLRDDAREEVLTVHPDGSFGKHWHIDSPLTSDKLDKLDLLDDLLDDE